ncbi:MAG: four helix bundle protein [Caulobacter sp.]|nr:four helix bundle protein [Caulobacter sp.]
MASYRDLLVWRKAMDLAEGAYALGKLMPKAEQFRLTAQLLRAAVSVPANIAEGRARTGRREFLHFLSIASGSLAETETLLMLAVRSGLLERERALPVFRTAEEVGRMLTALKQNLSRKASAA